MKLKLVQCKVIVPLCASVTNFNTQIISSFDFIPVRVTSKLERASKAGLYGSYNFTVYKLSPLLEEISRNCAFIFIPIQNGMKTTVCFVRSVKCGILKGVQYANAFRIFYQFIIRPKRHTHGCMGMLISLSCSARINQYIFKSKIHYIYDFGG